MAVTTHTFSFPMLQLACARRLIHAPDAFEAHSGLVVAYAHPPKRVTAGAVISALQIRGGPKEMDVRIVSENMDQTSLIWLDEADGTPLFFVTLTILLDGKEDGTKIQVKIFPCADERTKFFFLDFVQRLQNFSTDSFVSISESHHTKTESLLARHRAVFIRQQKKMHYGDTAFYESIDW